MADRYRDRWGNEYTSRRGDYQQDYGQRDFENYPEDFDRDYDYGRFSQGRDWDYGRRGSYYGRGFQGNYGQGYQGGYGQGYYGQGSQGGSGQGFQGGYGQGSYGQGFPGGYGRGYQGGSGQGYQGSYYGSQQGRFNRGYGGGSSYYGSDWDQGDFDTTPSASWSYTEIWLIPGPFTGRGPRNYQRSDDKIQDDINDRLTQHGQLDAGEINVQVNNGEVTLTGTVNSRRDKRMAEDVAESVSGVTDVHNQLRVQQQNQQTGQRTGQQMTSQTGQQMGQQMTSQTGQQSRMGQQQSMPQNPQGQQNK